MAAAGAATPHERRVATLAIGYADGYDRRFGNGAGFRCCCTGSGPPSWGLGVHGYGDGGRERHRAEAAQAGDVVIVFGEGLPPGRNGRSASAPLPTSCSPT